MDALANGWAGSMNFIMVRAMQTSGTEQAGQTRVMEPRYTIPYSIPCRPYENPRSWDPIVSPIPCSIPSSRCYTLNSTNHRKYLPNPRSWDEHQRGHELHQPRGFGRLAPCGAELREAGQKFRVLYPKPSTLNPKPSTLNPKPSTLNPQPSTLNPKP